MNHRKVRALQDVRRFNFERCIRYQSVAEHSFLVGLLCWDAALELESDCYGAMAAGMTHDLGEAVTGDIPFLVRRSLGGMTAKVLDDMALDELEFGNPGPNHAPLVDYCDALELMMYLISEQELGNTTLDRILEETMKRIRSHLLWDALSRWTLYVLDWPQEDICRFNASLSLDDFTLLKH